MGQGRFYSSLRIVKVLHNAACDKLQTGRRYFQWTNLFDWIVYIMAFLLVFDFADDAFKTGVRECWQWEMGAMGVVLAWLNLLGDIRQLPFLGIYVIMFFDIFKTFLKFVVVFLVFIVAFSLGFHTLLIGSETPFSDAGYSLLKTTVMMIGEFEFDGIFYDSELMFPVSSLLLFVAFIVIMAILLMNLLVGLAVDDIKAVQDQAVLKRLAMQVEQVLDVERLLPYFLIRRYFIQYEVIMKKPQRWWNIFTDVVSSRSIVKQVRRNEMEGVSSWNGLNSSNVHLNFISGAIGRRHRSTRCYGGVDQNNENRFEIGNR